MSNCPLNSCRITGASVFPSRAFSKPDFVPTRPLSRTRESGGRGDTAADSWMSCNVDELGTAVYRIRDEVDGGEGLAAERAIAGAPIEEGANGALGDETVTLGGEALAQGD